MKNKKFEINKFSTPSQDLDPVKTETEKLEAKLVKHLKLERILFLVIVLIVAGLVVLLRSSAVRFAFLHEKAVTKYSQNYYEIENASKEAAKQVVNEWVETGSVGGTK